MNLAQNQYDSETQEVARIARSIQDNHSDLSWGECIRLAEKHISRQHHINRRDDRP